MSQGDLHRQRPTRPMMGIVAVAVLLAWSLTAVGKNSAGIPYLTAWEPEDYGGAAQNWDITQDEHGLIYMANGLGVIQFDGAEWRWLDEDRSIVARSLDVGPGGVVYAGYHSEVGQFVPVPDDGFAYTPVSDSLPDSLRDFRDVWITLATDEYVYFSTYSLLFRAAIDSFGVIEDSWTTWPEASDVDYFQIVSEIDGEVYVIHTGRGLLRVDGDSLVAMPGASGDELYHIWSIVPFPGDRMLLAGYDGMYLYDGESLEPFDTPVAAFARERTGYNVRALSNGLYALGMESDGVVLFDTTGSIRRQVTIDMGLSANSVHNYPFQDHDGGLWLAHDHGVSRVELTSPFHRYTRSMGLRGGSTSLALLNGTLFTATPEGLAWLQPAEEAETLASFHYVDGIDMAWDVVVAADQVVAATDYSVFVLDAPGNTPTELMEGVGAYALTVDTLRNRVFVGEHDGGVYSMVFRDGRWVEEGKLAQMTSNVLWMGWDDDGMLWLSYGFNDPYWARLRLENLDGKVTLAQTDVYDDSAGYERANHGHPFVFQGERYLPAWYELYRYDSAQDSLIAISEDHPLHAFTVDNSINLPEIGPDGSLWFQDDWGALIRVQEVSEDSLAVTRPMSRYHNGGYGYLLPRQDELWTASAGLEIQRLELTESEGPRAALPDVLIRQVRAGADSILYNGANGDLPDEIVLTADQRDITLEFALPSYHEADRHEFQFHLIGAMSEWSPWNTRTEAQFTQLSPGSYQFALRGRDVSGRMTPEVYLPIRLKPHWSQTVWAMTLWVVLALGSGWAVVAWRIRFEQRRAAELDALVQQRTEQLQTSQATEREAEIKALHTEKLAATIAHEFNNPLAIIQAAAQLIESGELEYDTAKNFAGRIPPQVRRLDHLLQRLRQVKEFREVDYAAGMTILDIHEPEPPSGDESTGGPANNGSSGTSNGNGNGNGNGSSSYPQHNSSSSGFDPSRS